MRNSGMETIDSVEKSRSFLRSGGGGKSGAGWMNTKGGSRKGKHGEKVGSWIWKRRDARYIHFDTIPTLFSNYRARKIRTKTPGQRRAKFRNGRNPGNRSSSGRDSRQLSLSLSSIALELETRKFDTSTLCSASLPPPPSTPPVHSLVRAVFHAFRVAHSARRYGNF